jgi:hypothetical protein
VSRRFVVAAVWTLTVACGPDVVEIRPIYASAGDSEGEPEATSSTPSPDGSDDDDADAGGTTTSAGDAEVASSTSGGSDDATGAVDGSTGEPVLCDRALFVTGNTDIVNTVDAPLHARLVDLGFDVTIVDSPTSSATDITDHCVVILSAEGASVDIHDKFRDVAVGVVVLEPALYDDMQFVAAPEDLGWNDGVDTIEVVAPAHDLSAGLAGTVSIYDGGGRVSWGVPSASAQVVAIWPAEAARATLFAYEAGAALANDFVAQGRRVAFPGGTTAAAMTTSRVDLFEVAIRWAAGDIP